MTTRRPGIRIWLIVVGCLGLLGDFIAFRAVIAGDAGSGGSHRLYFETGTLSDSYVIVDRFGHLQLAVTRIDSDGTTQDASREVGYSVSREGVIRIERTGLVTPLSKGTATVTARDESGVVASTQVTVRRFAESSVPGFRQRIMPVLTKYGCNNCHGKPRGQNGFQLSLFGFDPEADHEALVRQAHGRRISPLDPDRSLMLLKASGGVPHGGSQRFSRDSLAHNTVSRWIGAGAPAGSTADITTTSLEVIPPARVMSIGGTQQVRVIARHSDGTHEDVTRLATFQTNDTEMVEVDNDGLVRILDQRGQLAVVIGYRGQVGLFRGTVPFGPSRPSQHEPRSAIDGAVSAQLAAMGIDPVPECTDAEFLRRVTIDLAGRIPTLEETDEFLAKKDTDKRDRLIDRLLDGPDYPDYFANKWLHLLRNRRIFTQQRRGSYSLHHWIRDSLRRNVPYDEFVREIVAASGDMSQHPPATWYRELLEDTEQVENMSQLFLGVRITCAKCHHHPFEKWSQKDYYSLTAFFSQVDRKYSLNGMWQDYERRIYHKRGVASKRHPVTGKTLKPAVLDGAPLDIDADTDPRQVLVDWMASAENPFFATVLVNRYWKHFFGRGIVEPEDDLRDTNPPSNPELLNALRDQFVDDGYDLKQLIRTICRSTTYQRSANASGVSLEDTQSFSSFYPRRLNAEVYADAIDQLLATTTPYATHPAQTRAVSLPDTGSDDEFLKLFGKPKAETSCGCERSQDGDLRQSLFLLISSQLNSKLEQETGRAARMARSDDESDADKITELYRRAFCRPPTNDELKLAVAHVSNHDSRQKAYQDLLWVMINTKEFMYNH